MSSVRSADLIAAYAKWQACEEGSFEQRLSANQYVDLWSKAPGLVKLKAAYLMSYEYRWER